MSILSLNRTVLLQCVNATTLSQNFEFSVESFHGCGGESGPLSLCMILTLVPN